MSVVVGDYLSRCIGLDWYPVDDCSAHAKSENQGQAIQSMYRFTCARKMDDKIATYKIYQNLFAKKARIVNIHVLLQIITFSLSFSKTMFIVTCENPNQSSLHLCEPY